jgi:hypothetical protein
MKRWISAIVVLIALGTAAVLACVSDPEGKMSFYRGNPYCIGGGHGCVECDSVDQQGDYLTPVSSGGVSICTGSIGGNPYTL